MEVLTIGAVMMDEQAAKSKMLALGNYGQSKFYISLLMVMVTQLLVVQALVTLSMLTRITYP